MRRLPLALAVAAALTLVLATAASSRPAAGITPVLFSDPVGDSGTAADVTSVSVTNDAGGTYSFDVGFATPLVPTSVVDIYLDTDLNPATGDPQALGADYLVEDVESDQSFGFYKWDGTQWSFVTSVGNVDVSTSTDAKDLKVVIGASDLGNSKGFNFFVESIEGDGSAGHIDDGPSGSGSWQYKLQSQLALSLMASHSFAVKAGGKWLVALLARRSDTGAVLGEGAIACSATSGSTKLAVDVRAFVSAGSSASAAVCEFKVPKKLKHKLLHGTLTVTFQGVSITRSFSQRVT